MDDDVLVFAQVITIIVISLAALATIGVLTFRSIRKSMRAPAVGSDSEQLVQLQQSVDAIAIEVERIAEAQRYTTKLLADRSDALK
jgi:hypothetical protein